MALRAVIGFPGIDGGLSAATANCFTVCVGSIFLTWFPSRAAGLWFVAANSVAFDPFGDHISFPCGDGFEWLEKVCLQISPQPRADDLLRFRADGDFQPLIVFPAMAGLIGLRCVDPYIVGGVEIDHADLHDVLAAHAGEPLEIDHRPDLGCDVWLDGFDVLPERGHSRNGFPAAAAVGQVFHAGEPVGDQLIDERVRPAPFEYSFYLVGDFVDCHPGQVSFDQYLPAGLQFQRPEGFGRIGLVQFDHRPYGGQYDVDLRRGLSVLSIGVICMAEVGFAEFGDRDAASAVHCVGAAIGCQPFGDFAVIV